MSLKRKSGTKLATCNYRGRTFQKGSLAYTKAMKPLLGQNEALNWLSKVKHARKLIDVRVYDPTKTPEKSKHRFHSRNIRLVNIGNVMEDTRSLE